MERKEFKMNGRAYRWELVQGAIDLHKVSLQKHFKLLDIKLLGDGAVSATTGSMAVPSKNIVGIVLILEAHRGGHSLKGYFCSGPENG